MFLTITTSKATPEQLQEVETFLHEFLPRLKQQPGVLAIYHYARPEQGDESTIIIWENEEAVKHYRTGDLIYETSKGVDIESFGIGTGCKLTQLHSISASSQYSLTLALLGSDLLTTDLNTSNIDTYALGSGGSITLKATVAGQITAPDSIAFQTYKKHHKTYYRILTGQATGSAPQVQDGNYAQGKGTITFLKNSPATDPNGKDGAAVIFDNTHSFLIQAEQFTSTLANYSANSSGLKFVSETPLAVSNEYPTVLVSLGTTLFVDMQFNGDLEACSLTSGGATGCATVATLTHSGVSSGMVPY